MEAVPAALPWGSGQTTAPLEVVVVHRDQPAACVQTVLALHRQEVLGHRHGVAGRRPGEQLGGEALGDHRRLAGIDPSRL